MEAVKGIYHPDKLDAETFITNFTIRLKELDSIIDNLKKQKKKPLQHFLITGKRGMGKSTLLRRLYLEARQKPLSDKLIAVRLGSEQYKLSKLFKLWEEVINYLSLEDAILIEKREKISDEKNYEEYLIHIIVDYLNKQDKTLLLLIDNFDQFVDKLTSKEQHTLREILIQYPIQIIGNTVFYGEHFFKYDKAFFDFFKPIHLQTLDKNEAEEFIKQLAANEGIEDFDNALKNQKGKIETLRILSGGVPRTLVILLSILSKRSTGDAIDYLNEMLEQVTPLYQDRMKALSPQQQEIMHHLAIEWDRTSAKELAKETRIPSKSISAQLAQLEDSGYINKISTSKRNHLYEIDERFFNIWLLMSESSPYDAKRVIWLTRWLDMFYDGKELQDFASYCSGNLKKAKPANRLLIVQALSESKKLTRKFRDDLVKETEKDLLPAIPEIKDWMMSYNKQRNHEINLLDKEIIIDLGAKNYETALTKLEQLKDIDEAKANFGIGTVYYLIKDYAKAEKYFMMAVEKGNESAIANLGVLYHDIKKNYDEAEKHYMMAVEKGNEYAMFNLGLLYDTVKKDYDKAEKYYLMAVKKGDVNAMVNLGLLYDTVKKDYDKAEKYYLMAVEKGDENAMANLGYIYDDIKKDYDKAEKYYLMAVEKENINAMVNLGLFYKNIKKDYNKAEKYYLMAVKKGDVNAMVNLGLFYDTVKKDYDKAEKYYLMAVEKGNEYAMLNLGYINDDIKKDYDKAEKYYLMAIEKGNEDAMFNLAFLYDSIKEDYDKAEKYYLMAIEKGNEDAMFNLAFLYDSIKEDYDKAEKYYLMAVEKGNEVAMFNLGFLYDNIKGDYDNAEKYYLMAVEKGDEDAMVNLGLLYYDIKKDYDKTEKYYLMAVEKGDEDGRNSLATLYYQKNDNVKKEAALKLTEEISKNSDPVFLPTWVEILLWNEKIKDAYHSLDELLETYLQNSEAFEAISNALITVLIFKQKHFLYKLFTEKYDSLKDKFKPIYFGLLQEMKDELPDEYLKMTEEISEPVNDLLRLVKEKRKRLGIE